MAENYQRLESKEERPSWLNLLTGLEWIALGIAVFLFVFYLSFQIYHANAPLDTELWGQFGDIIGGVVGTIIAYISIRLLVKTLLAQLDQNRKAKETADNASYATLNQQFYEKFKFLVDLYEEELENFGLGQLRGQAYLQDNLNSMFNKSLQSLNPNDSYAFRVDKAIKQFREFYANNRHQSSVYFRLIYRIFNILYYSGLKNKDQLPYAKIFRCQLSEEELFYLRYNAFTNNGRKMRQYINAFNLLKHLPVMSLLEFSQWKNKYANNSVFLSLIDTYFFDIRKQMITLCNQENTKYKWASIKSDGQKYITAMGFSPKNRVSSISVTKMTQQSSSDLERALDLLTIEEIKELLIDFCYELFVYSNFEEYMKVGEIVLFPDTVQRADKHIVRVKIKNDNNFPLILSQDQLNNPQ